MPPVRYYNQTAPFWDFVADLEERGVNGNRHQNNNTAEGDSSDNERRSNPWAEGWAEHWASFPWGPYPHRGRHSHHGPPAPPPPPHHEGPPPPPTAEGGEGESGTSEPTGPPPPFSEHPEEGRRHHGRHGHGPGPRSGGRCGRGGPGRGGFGGWGRGRGQHFYPYTMGMWDQYGNLAEMIQQQIFGGGEEGATKNKDSEDFQPDVDVFDTAEAFIVHVSLAGAKKEDVGVNWDAEKSELNIAGVVYRPGDEEFLKTLALDERKIGAFERKVRLGSRANPAQVDVESITARLEDGVLTVEVPKLDAGYVEIKKVHVG